MTPRRVASSLIVFVLWLAGSAAEGQRVVVRQGTPAQVVDLLKSELLPQRFVFVSANDKGALFTLDRGLITQRAGAGNAQVVLELRIRFKAKDEGLEVMAAEEVATTSFPIARQHVRSPKELENLQRLLDRIKALFEEQAAKPDSTPDAEGVEP